jgi:Peptidase M50B-like
MMASTPHPQARRRTAFHEAGHAVVAWALGRSVTGLRLLSEQDGEAAVEDAGMLPLVKQIAISMGGWYGAERSGVERLHDSDLQGDHAVSLSLTRSTFPYDRDGAFGDALHRAGCDLAEAIITRHADLLAKIASELEDRGELSASGIAVLLPPQPRIA